MYYNILPCLVHLLYNSKIRYMKKYCVEKPYIPVQVEAIMKDT